MRFVHSVSADVSSTHWYSYMESHLYKLQVTIEARPETISSYCTENFVLYSITKKNLDDSFVGVLFVVALFRS